MSSFNKVILVGRLTRDPELRCTPQGVPVSDLPLAVNRNYNTASGERREEVLFIDATVWRKQAEVCCQYLKKGRPILVEGHLSMDTWEGKDGQKQKRYRVVVENFQFLGSGSGRSESGAGAGESPEYSDAGGSEPETPPAEKNYGGNFRQGGGRAPYGGNRLAPTESAPADAPAPGGHGVPDDDIPF